MTLMPYSHQQRELAHCLSDANRPALGRSPIRKRALSGANLADDAELAVWTFIGMSELAHRNGDDATAIAAIDAAERNAGPIRSGRLASLLSAHRAQALAVANDSVGSEIALAQAECLSRDHDTGRDPLWLGPWWNPAALSGYAAAALLTNKNPRPAERAARTALRSIDATAFPCNAASYSTSLAISLAADGRIDESASAAVDTMSQFNGIHSARTIQRPMTLRPLLDRNSHLGHVPQALSLLHNRR